MSQPYRDACHILAQHVKQGTRRYQATSGHFQAILILWLASYIAEALVDRLGRWHVVAFSVVSNVGKVVSGEIDVVGVVVVSRNASGNFAAGKIATEVIAVVVVGIRRNATVVPIVVIFVTIIWTAFGNMAMSVTDFS